MKTNVLGITLAVTITGGLLALTASAVADGSKLQSANSSNVYAMKMDRCPYYHPLSFVARFEGAHDIWWSDLGSSRGR